MNTATWNGAPWDSAAWDAGIPTGGAADVLHTVFGSTAVRRGPDPDKSTGTAR